MKYMKTYRVMKYCILIIVCFAFQLVNAQNALSIDDAINIALKKNYDIRIARNDAQVSKENNTPGNAGMLPTLGIVGSGSYAVNNTTQKLAGGTENSYPNSASSSLSLGLQLNWTLFDGGKMFVTKSKLNEIQLRNSITGRNSI